MITTTVQAGVRLLLGVLRPPQVLHGHLQEAGGHNHHNHHNHRQVGDHHHRQEGGRSHHLVLVVHQQRGDYQERNQGRTNQVQPKQDGARRLDHFHQFFHAS